ncbi:MAG: hypothetical protein IPI58_04190 [Alphaproteobacteria bacterium]|nr:MAG: hypothetical protein IPI58_04190 [Alphaproteobacteria bacterium]
MTTYPSNITVPASARQRFLDNAADTKPYLSELREEENLNNIPVIKFTCAYVHLFAGDSRQGHAVQPVLDVLNQASREIPFQEGADPTTSVLVRQEPAGNQWHIYAVSNSPQAYGSLVRWIDKEGVCPDRSETETMLTAMLDTSSARPALKSCEPASNRWTDIGELPTGLAGLLSCLKPLARSRQEAEEKWALRPARAPYVLYVTKHEMT